MEEGRNILHLLPHIPMPTMQEKVPRLFKGISESISQELQAMQGD